ncbi:MAG: aminoacyl-tRNA hydrolase [Candidatus Omnitrophica bacterium]|nr:aminoacyl-tRNA hydrolase [Candidatus Omnitrophota bacterium]
MKILIGLGNPGHTYHGTRHNVGFAVIQQLAHARQVALDCTLAHPADGRPAAVYGDYTQAAQPIRLLMPLTMMNESGDALKALAAPAEDLLIICDDVNLPLGTIRLKAQGGAGGHHGLVSCLEALGTDAVARLRIGVGTTRMPQDLEQYVLCAFPSEECAAIKQAIQQAVEACEAWARDGIDAVMNRYNAA